jgi:hypothetical protein
MKLLLIPALALLMIASDHAQARPTECFAIEAKAKSMVQQIVDTTYTAGSVAEDADTNRRMAATQTGKEAVFFNEAADKAEARSAEMMKTADVIQAELIILLQGYLDRDCVQNEADYKSVMRWME